MNKFNLTRSVFVSLKPKTEKVYIPPFKRNDKEKAYFARLDKGKSFDVDAEVFKPKTEKVYIPHFKRNNKEKAYFARLDKSKSSDVDVEVSKPMSKPIASVQKKYVFVPTCYLCGVVGHIRPNCFLLRQKPKSETRFIVRNTDVLKFVHVCHFCGISFVVSPVTFILLVIN